MPRPLSTLSYQTPDSAPSRHWLLPVGWTLLPLSILTSPITVFLFLLAVAGITSFSRPALYWCLGCQLILAISSGVLLYTTPSDPSRQTASRLLEATFLVCMFSVWVLLCLFMAYLTSVMR